MRPLPFTYPYWIPFWILFVGCFFEEMLLVRRGQKQAVGNAQDAGSLQVINIVNQIAMFTAFLVAFRVKAATITQYRVAVFWIGVALLLGGTILRRHCWRILGENFTGAVVVNPEQKVIERGAYRFVRHPSYTGGMLMFTGIGVALGNWLSFALLLILPSLAYAYRVRVEERALVATIGEPYRDYMRRRKRFIPWVF